MIAELEPFTTCFKDTMLSIGSDDGPLDLDPDRECIVDDFTNLLHLACQGRLHGNIAGRLIAGRKGTGKTTLLQALLYAAQKLTKVLTIYVNADFLIKNKQFPLDIIKQVLRDDLQCPDDRLDNIKDSYQLIELLKLANLRLVLAIDEYHNIYSRPEEYCLGFALQVQGLINSPAGRAIVLVSGSDTYLRSLAFGTADQDRTRWPGYSGKVANLNSSRTASQFAHELRTRAALLKFLEGCPGCPAELVENTEDARRLQDALFAATGGRRRHIVRAIEKYNKHREFPVVSNMSHLQGAIGDFPWLVKAMYAYWRHQFPGVDLSVNPWAAVQDLSIIELQRWYGSLSEAERAEAHIQDMPPQQLQPKNLYEAMEAGSITYVNPENEALVIRFAEPMVALLLQDVNLPSGPKWFSHRMRIALRFPYGQLGIDAERAVAELLHTNGLYGACVDHIDDGLSHTLHVRTRKDAAEPPHTLHLHTPAGETDLVAQNLPWGKTMKIIPDYYGVDILTLRDEAEPTAYGIQVKLGVSKLDKGEADKIVARMEHSAEIQAALEAVRGSQPIAFKKVLMTTRPLVGAAPDVLADAGIEVLTRDELRDKWPSCMKSWAAAAQLEAYANSLE